MLRICDCGFVTVLVKPVETDRQPKNLIVVPEDVCLEFVLLAVSDVVNNLLECTGKVALTRECPCTTTTVNELCRMNRPQQIARPLGQIRLCDNDPFVAQFIVKPPVGEEFGTSSGGRLEEQRR